ncbi:MAG: FAD-dependent oxidoreductase [Caldilineaceae bacterium]|nr:FAD-dependent oxidoreductase [Caldilineaceae bacterium]MBP9074653.1 FAD-dependent oxidoreductase [Caldilineaceae bacterium]
MNYDVDVLIVGAGVIGITTAHYLLDEGRSPVVIDKGDVCAGASYGNAGLLVPSHAIPLAVPGVTRQGLKWLLNPDSPFYIKPRPDPELMRWLWHFQKAATTATMDRVIPVLLSLGRASMDLFKEFAQDPALAFNFEQKGGLYLYASQAGLDGAVAESRHLAELGVKSTVLDTAGVNQIMPVTKPGMVGGVFYPADAHIVPDRFVTSLAQKVQDRGGAVHGNTEVLGIKVVGRKVMEVQTTRGLFRPKQVVLAAGAWSATLAKQLGLRLPVQPAKGYSITIQRPANFPELHMHLGESKIAVTPMAETLRFAGTLEMAGLDLSINPRRVEAIRRGVVGFLDVDPHRGLVEIWRGLRPLSPDTLPIIGPSPKQDNLVLCTGHGMLGISLGPISGKLAAQIVAGVKPDLDPEPLRLERF